MESGENMPDKNDVNNEENELLNQLLNEIKEDNKDISEEELEKLKSIIESMVIPKLSKKEIFKQKIKHNRFVIYFTYSCHFCSGNFFWQEDCSALWR